MNKLTLSALTIGIAFATTAQANALEGKSYFGANYEMIGYDESGLSGNYVVTALALKAGYFVNPNFAIEGKLGFGLGSGSDTETFSGTDVNLEVSLDSYFSLLAVGLLPVTEDFNVYGKIGFSSISLSATGSAGGYTASASDSGSSLSYYFGGEYKIQSDLSLNAGFGSLYNRENVTTLVLPDTSKISRLA